MRLKNIIVIVPLATLLFINFANAGATHTWCGASGLPEVKLCQDLQDVFIRDGRGPVLEFRFTGHGEDRSINNYSTGGGEFKLISTDWGQDKLLMNSQGDSYQIQCGLSKHGMCPSNVERWPAN